MSSAYNAQPARSGPAAAARACRRPAASRRRHPAVRAECASRRPQPARSAEARERDPPDASHSSTTRVRARSYAGARRPSRPRAAQPPFALEEAASSGSSTFARRARPPRAQPRGRGRRLTRPSAPCPGAVEPRPAALEREQRQDLLGPGLGRRRYAGSSGSAAASDPSRPAWSSATHSARTASDRRAAPARDRRLSPLRLREALWFAWRGGPDRGRDRPRSSSSSAARRGPRAPRRPAPQAQLRIAPRPCHPAGTADVPWWTVATERPPRARRARRRAGNSA